jgi:hypothetical protein
MRLRPLLLVVPFLSLGACAIEGHDGSDPSAPERGGLGKADIVGSCETPSGKALCDGPGIGNCWCDDLCVDFGDCCSDAEDVCGIVLPPPEGKFCGGWLGDTCDDDEYCAYQPGQWCGWADASSTCETRPEVCIQLFAPVCGCDGQTYSNSCFAAAAGTGVLHDGECEVEPPPPGQFCGGIAGFPCPDGEICVDDPSDDCDPENGGADCGGICVPAPDECQPVLCALFCEDGFVTDDDGCEICQCAEPEPEPEPCQVGGCNGELCAGPDDPLFSICIALPEAPCYALSSCGNFGAEGSCGWEPTQEFVDCMSSFGIDVE